MAESQESSSLDAVATSDEQTPLLDDPQAPEITPGVLNSEDIPEPETDCDEAKAQCQLSLPLGLTYLVSSLCALTDIIFLGHISKDALAAAGQATVWIGIFVAIGAALASGGTVLAGQATGQNQPEKASLILLRGVIVSFLFTMPAMAAFYYTWWWSTLLDAKPEVVTLAGDFGRIMLYGVPAQMVDFLIVDFIQSVAGEAMPVIVVTSIVVVMNAIFNYFFIYTLKLGFDGSPLATVCTSWMGTIVLLIYVCVKMPETRERIFCGWDLRKAFSCEGFMTYFGTAIPNLFVFLAGNFPLLILCFVASHMAHPETSLGSLNVIVQTVMIPMSMFGAIAQACGTRLSYAVGKSSESFCKRSIRVALYQIGFATLPIVILYVFLGRELANVLTSDPGIRKMVGQCFPFCSVALFCDGFKFVMGEILNAVGRSVTVAILELVYAATFFGFIYMFWECGTKGVLGLVLGWMAANLCYLIYATPSICCLNWEFLTKRREENSLLKNTSEHHDGQSQ